MTEFARAGNAWIWTLLPDPVPVGLEPLLASDKCFSDNLGLVSFSFSAVRLSLSKWDISVGKDKDCII